MSIELSPQQEQEVLRNISIISGSAHPELTSDIAHHMGVKESPAERDVFPNSEGYICLASVRKRHIFIVQPHTEYTDSNGRYRGVDSAIMEQAMMIEAAHRSSADEITAVVPLLGYARQDKKQKGGEAIAAEIPLRVLQAMGADRVVSVDVHSSQTPASFRGPFDHLTAQPELRKAIRQEIKDYDISECVVVEPDAGSAKRAWRHAQALDLDTVAIRKVRDVDNSQDLGMRLYGDVDGMVCIIFDDMIDTAGTVVKATEMLKNKNAKAIFVAATHGILSDPAIERLKDAPIDRLLISDTVPSKRAQEELGDKLLVVKFAPVIARALTAIATGKSVSEIFKGQNYM